MTAASAAGEKVRFRVRRDRRTIGKVLRRIRRSQSLTDLFLFGRRTTARMLDYVERRTCDRAPVQMPIYVTPVDFDGRYAEVPKEADCETFAFTKDVSLRGVGFTHDELLEGNYAIVTFDLMDSQPVSLLLEVRWSNLEMDWAYLSGGRFLGIAEAVDS